MFVIIAAVCLLALGKIAGQGTVVSQIIITETLPISASSTQNEPISVREIRRYFQPPQLSRRPSEPTHSNSDTDSLSTGNIHYPPQPTVTQSQARRRLFLSRRISERTYGYRPDKATNNMTTNNINVQNNSDVFDSVHFEGQSPVVVGKYSVEPPKANESNNVTHATLPKTNTPAKPATVTNAPNTTEVTLDERANFDGDQCPTGYVKVNGMCVQQD